MSLESENESSSSSWRAQIARASEPWNHSSGSVPIIRVPGCSETRPRLDSGSRSDIALIHRSTIRWISSEGSTSPSLVRSVRPCTARAQSRRAPRHRGLSLARALGNVSWVRADRRSSSGTHV